MAGPTRRSSRSLPGAQRSEPAPPAAVARLEDARVSSSSIAIATDLNDVDEAWSTEAGLTVPWPIILFQLALTAVAVLGRRRFAIAAALLLTATCAVSVMSGLFDGDLFAEGLGPSEKAFQIVLISWMALVGLLAALRTAELLRMRGELEASM